MGQAVTIVDAGGTALGPVLPRTWSDPTVAQDMRRFANVEVQVVGTPGTALTPQRSLDSTTGSDGNFVTSNAYDKDGNTVTIAAAGIYSIDGGGFVKLTGTVAPAVITLRAA